MLWVAGVSLPGGPPVLLSHARRVWWRVWWRVLPVLWCVSSGRTMVFNPATPTATQSHGRPPLTSFTSLPHLPLTSLLLYLIASYLAPNPPPLSVPYTPPTHPPTHFGPTGGRRHDTHTGGHQRRNELFGISGLRGKYPQLFVDDTFVGSYEECNDINEGGEFKGMLPVGTPMVGRNWCCVVLLC